MYTRQFGSDTYDYAKKIVADPIGNVYVAGYTLGVINAPSPPGAKHERWREGRLRGEVRPQGALLWVTQFGSTGDDSVGDLPPQHSGTPSSLYVAGSTNGIMPGNPNVRGNEYSRRC